MIEEASPKFTGERVIERKTPQWIWLDHVARYKFSSRFVKGKEVLDISCGTGYGSRILYDSGAAKVIGVDISSEAIEFTRTKYKIDELEFNVGDVLNIDFSDDYFNIVVSFECIERIRDQEKALLEIRRVLEPNALLLILSPNRKMKSPFKSINAPPNNPFDVVEYSMKEFVQLLGNYFEISEVYGQKGLPKAFLLPFIERMLRKILP